ncbi:MAG TPA: branched-chain amino acid ABC transporter substrate-binding protein [Burkholderiales bacterium]|nr:branched-chain amino acid ABC transporter substrate-binding protein [Burkholderiales bacterium]
MTKPRYLSAMVVASLLTVLNVQAAEPVRIATIQPLSGPFALQGEEITRQFTAAADRINADGGIYDGRKIEIVALDGKATARDSLLALRQAVDMNISYVTSNISSVVHALSDAVAKHNRRNPDKPILLINTDARDPALTETKCHFWHFRLNYHTDTEIDFLTDYLVRQPSVQKVYLINQDYAYGHAIQNTSRELLKQKRPDIQIVGESLIPLGKVKDFTPYAAKIRAAGADTVITGNWGNDMFLLVRAGNDSGLDVGYYILVGNVAGSTTGIGAAGVGKVWSLFPWHANADPNPYADFNKTYREQYNSMSNYDYIPAQRAIAMLNKAFSKARSDDPMKVALALEGMTHEGPEGMVQIRAEDHQLVAPLYLAALTRVSESGVPFDTEDTGLGWETVYKAEGKDFVPPVNCTVERP